MSVTLSEREQFALRRSKVTTAVLSAFTDPSLDHELSSHYAMVAEYLIGDKFNKWIARISPPCGKPKLKAEGIAEIKTAILFVLLADLSKEAVAP